MFCRAAVRVALTLLSIGAAAVPAAADEPTAPLPAGVAKEELPKEPGLARVVIVAGSSVYRPGEHDYLAGAGVLMNLLRQTPGVFPVLAVDWPEKPETLKGARSVVLFCDGGDKHPLLKHDHLAQVQRLADLGVGLVALHQVDDVPHDLGAYARALFGAAWEKGYSQRAHWVTTFSTFPDHPVTRGVTPFTIDDGWLYRLRFVPDLAGVTPLLRTVPPKAQAPAASATASTDSASIVSWAYDRPDGGRSFVFTGGHLHRSLAEEGYRKFLVNGILWSARVEVPASGAPVALTPDALRLPSAPQPSR